MNDAARAPRLFANALAAAGVLILLAALAWAWAAPASRWLDVRLIVVADAREGGPIYLWADRAIHREAAGWHQTVLRRREEGGLVVACKTPRLAQTWRPGARLPAPLTLDWWTEGALRDVRDAARPCPLAVGSYEIETTWTQEPPGYPDKTQTRRAAFAILPRAAPR